MATSYGRGVRRPPRQSKKSSLKSEEKSKQKQIDAVKANLQKVLNDLKTKRPMPPNFPNPGRDYNREVLFAREVFKHHERCFFYIDTLIKSIEKKLRALEKKSPNYKLQRKIERKKWYKTKKESLRELEKNPKKFRFNPNPAPIAAEPVYRFEHEPRLNPAPLRAGRPVPAGQIAVAEAAPPDGPPIDRGRPFNPNEWGGIIEQRVVGPVNPEDVEADALLDVRGENNRHRINAIFQEEPLADELEENEQADEVEEDVIVDERP